MKKLLLIIIAFLLCFVSCKTIQYVPIETDTKIEYRDTTVYKDSIVYIPKETIKEVVPMLDTLSMETNMATATAWLDTTTTTLKGRLENKKGIEYKYIYKDKIQYRDSIQIKEVPVEVTKEVVKHKHYFYEPILWLFTILSLFYIIYRIIKKKLLL